MDLARQIDPRRRRAMLAGATTMALAVVLGTNGELPTEFRLFTTGWNDTEHGPFLFDTKAADETLAAYKAWGVDLMIDLEHQALDPNTPPEPTARDARGWCQLELRDDGSLWAVNVTWTKDGAERLTDKRQRYVSPAFGVDRETKRITSILNIAITAIPATHDTPALVAAATPARTGAPMTLEEFMKVVKALGLDPSMTLEAAMAKIKGEGGTDPDADTEDAPPPAGDGGADESTEDGDVPAPEQPAEVAAASARLMRLTGKKTVVDAVAEVETYRTSHLELETERQKLSAERATLELAERRKLCIELVTLGAEFPSTVWADDKATTLKPRWLSMSIDTLRAHTTEQRAARGGKSKKTGAPVPPVVDGDLGLTPAEIAKCAAKKIDPAVYAKTKADIAARNAPRAQEG